MSAAERRLDELRLHPRASLVPDMDDKDYRAFLADVEEHGLQTPLEITPAGVVLNGRQRLRAARELGHTHVPVREVSPKDEVAYILRAALCCRHLSASQRAALALELDEYEQAKERAQGRRLANLQPEVATLPPPEGKTRELAAQLGGVSARTVQDAITVREESAELFEQVKAGAIPANRAARQVRQARLRAEIGNADPLPERPFQVIYADPPWPSANSDSDWAPENHYPTMKLEEIKGLPIPIADDAVLFLWALGCQLPRAFEVIEAWGFRYVAEAVWVKQSIGLGSWVRYRHEPLLIAVRGAMRAPDPEDRFDSVIEAPRRQHSRKPDRAYELIERAYQHCSKLELFARGKPRTGWSTWGNQVEP